MRYQQLLLSCFLFTAQLLLANGFVTQPRSRRPYSPSYASLLEDTYASESTPESVDNNSSRWESVLQKLEEKMGTIDDSRVLFPEYESQQVSRLYSSLQYQRQEGELSVSRKEGNVWTAGALIAGTALGAGIGAFPVATADIGFVPSAVALTPAWIYMTISGLLLAELHLNRMAETGKLQHHLLDLVDLGKPWNTVATGSYFAVEYALVAYYLSQQQQVIDPIVLAGILGSAVVGLRSNILQKMNAVLLASALLAFGVATFTSGGISWNILLGDQHPELVLNCLPILFMSLVYQSVVPAVVSQLEGDRTKITQAVIGGTTLPFVTMLTWNAFSLGGANLDSPAATCFTSLALFTSLLSLTSSLTSAWENAFLSMNQEAGVSTISQSTSTVDAWKRCTMVALALLPPLAFQQLSEDASNSFAALEYAGIFGASTLFLILTPIAAWNERYRSDKPIVTKPMVPFGKIPLGSMWKAAATLIIEQGAEKLGVFEFLQHHFFASSI
jgi:tyrosine-specific transport protein